MALCVHKLLKDSHLHCWGGWGKGGAGPQHVFGLVTVVDLINPQLIYTFFHVYLPDGSAPRTQKIDARWCVQGPLSYLWEAVDTSGSLLASETPQSLSSPWKAAEDVIISLLLWLVYFPYGYFTSCMAIWLPLWLFYFFYAYFTSCMAIWRPLRSFYFFYGYFTSCVINLLLLWLLYFLYGHFTFSMVTLLPLSKILYYYVILLPLRK